MFIWTGVLILPFKRELGRRHTGLSVNTQAFVSEDRKVT